MYLAKVGLVLRLIVEHHRALSPPLVDLLYLGEIDHTVVPLYQDQIPRFERERRLGRRRHILQSCLYPTFHAVFNELFAVPNTSTSLMRR